MDRVVHSRAFRRLHDKTQLYLAEAEAQKRGLTGDKLRRWRKKKVPPLADKLKAWMDAVEPTLVPTDPLAEAIRYYRNHWDALFRFAIQRVKQVEAAEDLVQETFLAAVQSRDRFKGQSTEKTWLFSILKHKLIDYYRKQKIRSGGELLTADEDDQLRFAAGFLGLHMGLQLGGRQHLGEHRLHVLDVPDEICLARLRTRNASGDHPFSVSEDQFREIARHFEHPGDDEGFDLVHHRTID